MAQASRLWFPSVPPHLRSHRRDACATFQRPQIQQQFLRVRERFFIRLFQPAEFPQILHPGGFERQHDFGQVEPFDFRQFLPARCPCSSRDQSRMQTPGAVRPARPARWSALDWLIFSMSSVLMPRLAS